MKGLSDTSPEAERVLVATFRRMTPAWKWHLLGRAYDQARALHAAALRREVPQVTPREITADWARRALGVELPLPAREPPRRPEMANLHDFVAVAAVLNRLNLTYALGGSMASSLHGVIRHTNDADVVALPFPGRELELIEALGPDYYVSESAVRQAIARRSSFNLINTVTGFKVDVFVSTEDEFEQSVMARREALEVEEPIRETIYIQTAEDTLLSKLRWYRLGNEVSEQQWKDVLGVVKTRQGRLDDGYLKHWAERLGVADLLARAFAEGAVPE
jgi:hypothetical protein